ncbi:Tm-1-like ATP-binding domain-containing protein [Clostridium sp. AM58-1XD]|uniref:Tm-1-like ATP-binding domain-containing protein n=1 Tax=Clostridium sp. AM58-1XD TaxID=2292307 RepID=UPI000E46BA4C|nr:Tm-1-like ATP-binding domain-containing protein [Clostridium sp. AM58-1XD]RGY96941.1 UPF0261 family protein [Clostridium sp. AM58-1XD]
MRKSIPIVVTMDTKGPEAVFLNSLIVKYGFEAPVIDVGTRNSKLACARYPNHIVCRYAGVGMEELASMRRDDIMRTMGKGASRILLKMLEAGSLAGVISIGGNQGSSIAAFAMEALPIGLPKLIISTVASGNIRPYVGYKDIMMMFSVFDFVGGMNSIGRTLLSNGAAAVAGMAKEGIPFDMHGKSVVAVTAFGNTESGVAAARRYLETKGYEVVAFHASGAGGSAMEYLIEQGYIKGVLDMTIHELIGETWGDDIYTPLRPRLVEAGKKGIPQVICPGAVDYFCFGAPDSIPEKYRGRKTHYHNPYNTNVRATAAEMEKTAQVTAEKLNKSRGKTAVMIPMNGFSAIGSTGGILNDPEADRRWISVLETHLKQEITVIKADANINEEKFAVQAAGLLADFMQEEKQDE